MAAAYDIATWWGEVAAWEDRDAWMGTPIPDPRPDEDDRVNLQAINIAPIISWSDPTVRELYIYKGLDSWGLTVNNGRTLTVKEEIVLEKTQYNGASEGVARLFLEGGAKLICSHVSNYGIIKASGQINADSIYNWDVGKIEFGSGSTLITKGIANYGSIRVIEQASWALSGSINNEKQFISDAGTTFLHDGTTFTNYDDAQFRSIVIEGGAHLISESSGVTKISGSITVEDGAKLSIWGYFGGPITEIINHGNIVQGFGSLRGNVENYGVIVTRGSVGDLRNYSDLIISGSISGNFISESGSTLSIVSSQSISLPDPLQKPSTGPLSVYGDVSLFQTTLNFDLEETIGDRIYFYGQSFSASDVSLVINAVNGLKIAEGSTFGLVYTSRDAASLRFSGNVTVLGQHEQFSYFVGVLAGTNDLIFRALNSGATGGWGNLDLSKGAYAADITVADGADLGSVKGGIFSSADFYDVRNVSVITATQFNDSIYAYEYGNSPPRPFSFFGLGGNDTLVGGRSNDLIDGGSGIDIMSGGKGNDIIVVDDANDVVVENVGGGADVVKASVSYTLASKSYVEMLRTTDDTGTAAINLTGNSLDNKIAGNAGANVLDGGSGGADVLAGYGGNDKYYVNSAADIVYENAGKGTDIVYSSASWTLGSGSAVEEIRTTKDAGTSSIDLTGNDLTNRIAGNAGVNILTGKGGDDTLASYGGADRLIGGLGADTLYGGTGNDVFLFASAAESGITASTRDRIMDFTAGDRIDLSAIDANASANGNQAFVLDTNASFSIGEIRQTVSGGNLLLEFNTDSDAAAEFSIIAMNHGLFTASDFVL